METRPLENKGSVIQQLNIMRKVQLIIWKWVLENLHLTHLLFLTFRITARLRGGAQFDNLAMIHDYQYMYDIISMKVVNRRYLWVWIVLSQTWSWNFIYIWTVLVRPPPVQVGVPLPPPQDQEPHRHLGWRGRIRITSQYTPPVSFIDGACFRVHDSSHSLPCLLFVFACRNATAIDE
jgi:hypothetical protein